MGPVRTCRQCGTDISGKRSDAKWCSAICRANASYSARTPERVKNRESALAKRVCAYCGSAISRKTMRARFCSVNCQHKVYYSSAIGREKKNHNCRIWRMNNGVAFRRLNREQCNRATFEAAIRHLPEDTKAMRRSLWTLWRWCRCNGYLGYVDFIRKHMKESAA